MTQIQYLSTLSCSCST